MKLSDTDGYESTMAGGSSHVDDRRYDAATRGYGPGWDELRDQTLRRDRHTCRRCGVTDAVLQAHHVVPRSAGGRDSPSNLVTLCRPCHGVMHPNNGSFDEDRPLAPLFPIPDAPRSVARMREPDDQVCDRCGKRRDAPELVSYTASASKDDPLVLCKPCAGLLVDRELDFDPNAWNGMDTVSRHELDSRNGEATVQPSVFADGRVAARRAPTSWRERIVDDTPLRFALNNRPGRWLLAVSVLYLVLVSLPPL